MAAEERVVELFVVAAKPQEDAQAELVFAYPDADTESAREFSESVTMFMFPHGFGKDWDKRALPPPPAHNLFALTDATGEHLYGAALCFYETLPPSSPAAHAGHGEREENSSSSSSVQYQAKAICLLGKRPFYTQLLRYLEQLFLLGTRQARANGEHTTTSGERWFGIEKTLCNLFHEVPVPHRGLAVQLSIADVEIVLERPLLQEFPFEMDAELMTYAFMMVEPRVMLQLYHHVLLEHRILIVCADSVLATAIAEAAKCLVFPLTWLHVYIPNIPDSLDLSTLLEAPVPFIAGAHTRQLDRVDIPPNVVKLEFAAGKFVFGSGAASSSSSSSSSEVALPALPEVSQRVASKLGTMRLPDFASQKREFHEKMWNRRVQLQKMCMSSASASGPPLVGAGDAALSKALFLARPNALYRKAMKLYLEIMAALLAEYPAFVSHDGNQTAFDTERFVERKPAGERAFYREFVATALFQSFLAQHNDHVSGSLAHDDAAKLQFVHRRMLSDGEDARGSFAVPPASKTFVAHAPQLPPLPSAKQRKKSFVLPPRLSFSASGSRRASQSSNATPPPAPSTLELESVNVRICFPEIDTRAFGSPRPIAFPTLANDAKTSSLGTFLTASKSKQAASKELGVEWMQQIMKTVSMPSVPFRKPEFLVSSSSTDLHAAFKRSRTFDRLGKAPLSSTSSSTSTPSQFYRTMTQRALGSSASLFKDSSDGAFHHVRRAEPPTRAAPVVKSIWLVTTSACACRSRVEELTAALTRVLAQHERNSSHASDAYCALIDCLGSCGHPGEAKAVFEECLSGSHLLSLEGIAGHKHFWKPFSCLLRCYVLNGLVQRAFDVLVQVKLEEEQCLDPSLGALAFGAQVLSSESEVLVERIYATFSCGNIGMYLAARDSGAGAEVIAFEPPAAPPDAAVAAAGAAPGATPAACCVKEYDVVETINGEVVLQYPLKTVVERLKQAYRPMTLTFLRGLPKLESVASDSDPTSNNSSSSDGESKLRPRRDLCDRFGLLPQRGIRLTTLADCASCGARASLPEIQEGWAKSDANDYTTRCAKCGHRYVPRLCAMLGGVTTAFFQPAHGADDCVRVEQFEYLSTLVIRKELANLAQKLPLTMLSMAELRAESPRIYWNIVVKLLSLACPLDFLDLPDMTGVAAGAAAGGAKAAAAAASSSERSAVQAGREGACEPESNEMHELQAHFMRTLHELEAQEGRVAGSMSLATVERMLRDLERHARDALRGGECGADDAEEDERRSCRTASLADSESVDTSESEVPSGDPHSRVSALAPFQRKARVSTKLS